MSPGRRIGREQASEVLFPHLGAAEATNSLRKALSMAKTALSSLGDEASGLLLSDRSRIWVQETLELEVDFELLQRALRSALSLPPGEDRDQCLRDALSAQGALLEDEQYVDWALRPRDELEALRHEARLAVARDRNNGFGRTGSDDVLYAWEACSRADPASEEAAITLIQAYSHSGRHAQAAAEYKRCCAVLEELGIRASPALERVIEASSGAARRGAPHRPSAPEEERRLITVLFAELVEPASETEWVEPEDLRERVGGALTGHRQRGRELRRDGQRGVRYGRGGPFWCPQSHEDDPERALRAAIGAVASVYTRADGLSLRVGVESGPAVVGSIGGGSSHHYAALGDVVRIAGALQSQAGTASVLVGPATYRATEGIFDWGEAQEVAVYPGANPILANYVQRQKTRRQSEAGRRRLAGAAPLVGRDAELSVVREALNDATRGSGRVLAVIGEPGLGKTRLVQECRKLFTSWVGGVPGRLPLWLEARAASYGSTQPYGLYQQLLAAWLGIIPEDSERGSFAALERAPQGDLRRKAGRRPDPFIEPCAWYRRSQRGGSGFRLGPEKFQQACFSAVRDLLGRIVGHGPTVVVLEDLHWADPTSLRLTETISSLTNEGPLLRLVTRRPGARPGHLHFRKGAIERRRGPPQAGAQPAGGRFGARAGPGLGRRGLRGDRRRHQRGCRREPPLYGGKSDLLAGDQSTQTS